MPPRSSSPRLAAIRSDGESVRRGPSLSCSGAPTLPWSDEATTLSSLAYVYSTTGFGITPDVAFQKALTFVEEYKAKAVIIDSMGLAMQGDMEKGREVLAFHGKYINPLRRAGATPFIVDHEGKLQTGEKHKDKPPFGSAYKAWASRSVLQFVF